MGSQEENQGQQTWEDTKAPSESWVRTVPCWEHLAKGPMKVAGDKASSQDLGDPEFIVLEMI